MYTTPSLLTLPILVTCTHVQWIKDFEMFQAAVENDTSYSSSLSRSLCLVLDEFYRNMPAVGVSAITGAGMKEFFKAVDDSAEEYMNTYR